MGFGARARRSCARTSLKQSKCNFEGGRAIGVCAKEAAVWARIIRTTAAVGKKENLRFSFDKIEDFVLPAPLAVAVAVVAVAVVAVAAVAAVAPSPPP